MLTDAVRIRSDNRFRASAHVSGGLDSGVVASITRKEYGEQNEFCGFSWSPAYNIKDETVDFDERLLVEGICRKNNIEAVNIDFTQADYLKQLKNWRSPGEFIFENKVIERAKNRNVNLIFSGWGGDEFISIGHRGIDADLFKELSWVSLLKKYPLKRPRQLISALLFNVLFPQVHRSYSKYKADPAIYPYIEKGLGSNLIPGKHRFRYGSRRKVHLQLLNLGHLANRAANWYVHGQHNGIDYRYPLLDRRIIEYMLKIPSRCLVGGNNYRIILRFIGKDVLPAAVIDNKSKNDPVRSHFFMKYNSEVNKVLIQEFKDFYSNSELDFVDFDLLQRNIETWMHSGDKKLEEGIGSVLYCLKSAHEFTKGYNG